MVKLTLLARVTDGLPLAEGLDDDQNHDLDQFKMQAKVWLRGVSIGLAFGAVLKGPRRSECVHKFL